MDKTTNKITLADVVAELRKEEYEAYEIPRGIRIANMHVSKEEYLFKDIQDEWDVIHTENGLVIDCKEEITDELIDNLESWAYKLPRFEFLVHSISSSYKTDLPDEDAFNEAISILNTKGYDFHAVEIDGMKYAISINDEYDVISYLRYMKPNEYKWSFLCASHNADSCVIASDKEHPDMSELVYWAKSVVSKKYLMERNRAMYGCNQDIMGHHGFAGSSETDPTVIPREPNNPFGFMNYDLQGRNFNQYQNPFWMNNTADPSVMQHEPNNPFRLFGQINGGNFNQYPFNKQAGLDGLLNLICCMTDVHGKLDASAVKITYGSYKKALKAIIAAYELYKYTSRCNISNPSQQLNNCDKGGANMAQFGVITEQGDLGLGYDPLNEKDNKVVNESVRSSMNKTTENENDEE